MSNPYSPFYPVDWPSVPFHEGEVRIQKITGVHERVMAFAPRIIRPYMPEQHVEFYSNQPFIVAAARDNQGNMWATLLMHHEGKVGFVTSPDPTTLKIDARPFPGDAVQDAFQPGIPADIGLLGIEFETKRRNRVNGVVTMDTNDGSLNFQVTQSFGNCPQYIKPRNWWITKSDSTHGTPNESIENICKHSYASELTSNQISILKSAETIFVATGYRAEGKDVRYGNDAGHRGGPAGFLIVKDSKTLILPEFSGNNSFNSLGNIIMDPRMGISIPLFETGGMIQLSGLAELDMDMKRAGETYPGALRIVTFRITHVNNIPSGTFPVRFNVPESNEERQLQVTKIVQESANVKSFYLSPQTSDERTGLWEFSAGQHLPISIRTARGELLRTYSLSGAPQDSEKYFRISVKREDYGQASSYLHDQVQIGDILQVSKPAGDFKIDVTNLGERTAVLLSSGVGVTPILSMLHHFVERGSSNQHAIWIYGARDGSHHPFRDEVETLKNKAHNKGTIKLSSHIVYSRPTTHDTESRNYDTKGRIGVELIKNLVPDITRAEFFMCGPGAMTATLEDELISLDVPASAIHFETF